MTADLECRLAAILSADAGGDSRLVEDEVAAPTLTACWERVAAEPAEHRA
jgi:hypothetical protein